MSEPPSEEQPRPPYDPPPAAQNPYAPYSSIPNPYGGAQSQPVGFWPGAAPPDHPQATTVLILGAVGLIACQFLGPVAWVMGSRVKREITASGGTMGGMQQAQIGWILGIVASSLLILAVLGFLFFFVIAIIATAA